VRNGHSYSGTNSTVEYQKYGIIMDRIEKAIYNEIRNNLRIRWSDLRRSIVDEKKLISERPFREILNELVDKKIVYRDEVERGHTEYYVDKDFEDIEKRIVQAFKKELPEFKAGIKHIKKQRNKIPDDVLATYFVMLWKLSNHLDFKASILAGLTKNEKIIDVEGLKKLKLDLIDLISNSNLEKTFDMLNLADVYFQYETDEMKKEFKKDWKSRNLPFPNEDV